MEAFRDLLEENALRLTDCGHLHDYIPFILNEEETRFVKKLMEDIYVSVIFDGTSRLGDTIQAAIRTVSEHILNVKASATHRRATFRPTL